MQTVGSLPPLVGMRMGFPPPPKLNPELSPAVFFFIKVGSDWVGDLRIEELCLCLDDKIHVQFHVVSLFHVAVVLLCSAVLLRILNSLASA